MAQSAVDINSGNQTHNIWNEKTKARVQEFADLKADIKKKRAALNAKVQAGITGLIDDGFNKEGIEAAIKYANTEEENRKNWDLTFFYTRLALGHPCQDDLFAAAMQQQVEVAKKEK